MSLLRSSYDPLCEKDGFGHYHDQDFYSDVAGATFLWDASLGELRLGNFASLASGSGKLLNASNTGLLRCYADDGGDEAWATGSVPDQKVILGRYLFSHGMDQTGGHLRVWGVMGQVKGADAAWNTEQVGGTLGRLEITQVGHTVTLGGYGISSGVSGILATSGTVTVNTYHVAAAVSAIADIKGTLTQTGVVAGLYVGKYDTTNWSDGTSRAMFSYGLYIAPGAVKNGIRLGTSSSALTLDTYANNALQIYTTCASTDGSNSVQPVLFDFTMTGTGGVGGRMRVNMNTNVVLGGWANAFKALVDCKTNGGATGLLSVSCHELVLPASAGQGTYACIEGEIVAPTSWVGTSPVSFFYLAVTGATAANFDDYGYLFTLTGVTSGAAHVWYDNTSNAADEFIRVKTPAGDRYIVLSDSTTFS